jgi:hypothetical protein
MPRHLLTDFELMILLATLRVGDGAMACPLRPRSGAPAGGRWSWRRSTPRSIGLERNGLVSSSIGEPTPERGGRAKRFFQVTPQGMRAVKETQRALVALWRRYP